MFAQVPCPVGIGNQNFDLRKDLTSQKTGAGRGRGEGDSTLLVWHVYLGMKWQQSFMAGEYSFPPNYIIIGTWG